MDESRRIRFLYPPIIFLVALALGAWSSTGFSLCSLRYYIDSLPDVSGLKSIGLGAVGLLAIPALGFTIGTIPVTALRLFRRLFPAYNYEAPMSPENIEKALVDHLHGKAHHRIEDRSIITSAFGHGAISDGHKEWLNRRWNAFNLSLHSGTALILAIGVPLIRNWDLEHAWYLGILALAAAFFWVAICAWSDTRRMNDLLSTLPPKAKE